MEFPDRSFIKTESREYDVNKIMPYIKIENLKYNENSVGKTRESDECNFSSFEEIIIIEVLVELFAKELNRIEQLIKAIKKKSSDLNDSHFFENYLFKKELITNLIQTNDQILKNRFVSLCSKLYINNIRHKKKTKTRLGTKRTTQIKNKFFSIYAASKCYKIDPAKNGTAKNSRIRNLTKNA